MAIKINAPLKVNAVDINGNYLPKAEITYGPYESKADAVTAITSIYGSTSSVPLGVSFGVVSNNYLTEYQYKTGNFNTTNCIAVGLGTGIGTDSSEIVGVVDTNSSKSNTNYLLIEQKINALISCVSTLIDNVVFHAGTPFAEPSELDTQLNLLRLSLTSEDEDEDGDDDTSTTAICGIAICGKAICGN